MKLLTLTCTTMIALSTLLPATLISAPAHAQFGPYSERGNFQGIGNMRCGRMFSLAKADAKDKAKRFCRQTHGSGGRGITRTQWTKDQCSKTATTASGVFRFHCK